MLTNPPQFWRSCSGLESRVRCHLITVPDPLGEKVQQRLAPPGYFEPNHINILNGPA